MKTQSYNNRNTTKFLSGFLILLNMLPIKSFAADNQFERATQNAECNEDLFRCIYKPQNTSISNYSSLIRDVKDSVFFKTEGEILGEGYLKVDTTTKTKIVFWHDDKVIRGKIAAALKELDKGSDFVIAPGGYVDVTVSVFVMESRGFDNFMFEISPLLNSAGGLTPIANLAGSLASNGVYTNTLGFGNMKTAMLKMKFDFSRIKSWSQMLPTYSRTIPVGDDIGVNKQRTVWTGDGTSIYKEKDSAGLSISGKVQVLPQDPRRIQIKNLSLNYGLENKEKNSLIDRVSLFQGNMDLIAGEPLMIYSDELNISTESKQNNFIFANGNSTDSIKSRIAIFLTLNPVLKNTNPDLKLETALASSLSNEDLEKLPQGSKTNLQEILNTLTAKVSWGTIADTFGQRLSLKLSADRLTRNNFDKKIKVKIKTLGSKEDAYETISDITTLATRGLQVPPFKIEDQCKKRTDCELIEYLVLIEPDGRLISNKDIKGSSVLQVQYTPENGSAEFKLLTNSDATRAREQIESSNRSWFNTSN